MFATEQLAGAGAVARAAASAAGGVGGDRGIGVRFRGYSVISGHDSGHVAAHAVGDVVGHDRGLRAQIGVAVELQAGHLQGGKPEQPDGQYDQGDQYFDQAETAIQAKLDGGLHQHVPSSNFGRPVTVVVSTRLFFSLLLQTDGDGEIRTARRSGAQLVVTSMRLADGMMVMLEAADS